MSIPYQENPMGILSNLTKAALNVAVSPVALVVDLATLPASSLDLKGPFDRTADCLKRAGKCVEAAVEPDRD